MWRSATAEAMDLPDARRAFRDVPIVHVGTLQPGGEPHVVPLWFVWLQDGIYVSCRAGSRVHANLRRDPRVSLQFDRGRAWTELTGVVVSGLAEVLAHDDGSSKRAMSAWFDKYRGELSGTAFGAYVEHVDEPALFRVRPERLAGWSHARRERA